MAAKKARRAVRNAGSDSDRQKKLRELEQSTAASLKAALEMGSSPSASTRRATASRRQEKAVLSVWPRTKSGGQAQAGKDPGVYWAMQRGVSRGGLTMRNYAPPKPPKSTPGSSSPFYTTPKPEPRKRPRRGSDR